MNIDIMNGGNAPGAFSHMQVNNRLDPATMKPFVGEDGRAYISTFKGGDATDPANYAVQPVTNATLRRDEWKALDEAVLKVSDQRVGGIADLRTKGLVYNLGNAMGTTVLEWHDSSDAMNAVLTMDGLNKSDNDRPTFQYNYLPLPIIHVDYEINSRALAASRNMGNPLDTISAERASFKINVKLEEMLFTDTDYAFGETDSRSRNKIYSYLNHPDRNTVTLDTDWDTSGKTGAQILADVQEMKAAAVAARHHGPFTLYIPTAYDAVLDNDYSATKGNNTIRERLLQLDNLTSIVTVDYLTANNIILVQMTADVVRLVNGLPIQNVEWKAEGNFINKYKVLTIQVPQIRSDVDGRSGVVHMS